LLEYMDYFEGKITEFSWDINSIMEFL
jgi:hypothetical protein